MADVGKVSVYFCNNSAGSCNNIEYIMLPFQGPVSSRGAARGKPKLSLILFLILRLFYKSGVRCREHCKIITLIKHPC